MVLSLVCRRGQITSITANTERMKLYPCMCFECEIKPEDLGKTQVNKERGCTLREGVIDELKYKKSRHFN